MVKLTHKQIVQCMGIKLGCYLKHNNISQGEANKLLGYGLTSAFNKVLVGKVPITLEMIFLLKEKYPDCDVYMSESSILEIEDFLTKLPEMEFLPLVRGILMKEFLINQVTNK